MRPDLNQVPIFESDDNEEIDQSKYGGISGSYDEGMISNLSSSSNQFENHSWNYWNQPTYGIAEQPVNWMYQPVQSFNNFERSNSFTDYPYDQSDSYCYENMDATNLNLGGFLENASSSGSKFDYNFPTNTIPLPSIIENEDNVEEEDIGPAELSDLATGEDYTEPSDFSSEECKELRRSDTTLMVSGRSERAHPVAELNNFEIFDQLGGVEQRIGPDEELSENRYFSSKEALQWVIYDWAVRKNVELWTPTSSQSKLIMKCVDSNCPFRLYAKREDFANSWRIIKNRNPHICKRKPGEQEHVQLTASLIAGCVRQNLKEDLSLTVSQIKGLITTRYPGVGTTYNKLWRGRERAIEQLFGTWEGSYTLLPQILEAITRTTPGTKFKISTHDTTDDNVKLFKCAAWAYGPCIEAFKYLRPVITIDGGFLSGRYRGRLLMACGYDAENKLLPLAFGLVEEENLDNWAWFLRFVRTEVIKSNRKICVISDRHKGIKAVFDRVHLGWSEELGEVVHRYCMQHVCENLYKEAGSGDQSLKNDFKCRLANKKKPRRFIERWRILKKSNKKAYDFLKKIGKRLENDPGEAPRFDKWAQTYDKGYRWGIMTSNGSEALNSLFRVERTLPVVAIVEGTWYKCAKWFDDRHMRALRMQRSGMRVPQKIEDLLSKRNDKAALMRTVPLGTDRGEYEVQVAGERIEGGGYGPFKYTVTISNGESTRDDITLPQPRCTCECRKPQLTGIPCSHVIAVCQHRNFDVYQLIDERYNTQNVVNTWSGEFHSYGDQEVWPPYIGPKLIPNKDLINRGRRQKVRRKMVMDEMEGRRRDHGRSRTNPRKKKTREPLPMATLQRGRVSSTVASPTINQSAPDDSRTFQSARYSTNYDSRDRGTTSRPNLMPSRFSIDVPRDTRSIRQSNFQSARHSVDDTRGERGATNRTDISTLRDHDKVRRSWGGRILNYIKRGKKK